MCCLEAYLRLMLEWRENYWTSCTQKFLAKAMENYVIWTHKETSFIVVPSRGVIYIYCMWYLQTDD
jgi:hypothetical protein